MTPEEVLQSLNTHIDAKVAEMKAEIFASPVALTSTRLLEFEKRKMASYSGQESVDHTLIRELLQELAKGLVPPEFSEDLATEISNRQKADNDLITTIEGLPLGIRQLTDVASVKFWSDEQGLDTDQTNDLNAYGEDGDYWYSDGVGGQFEGLTLYFKKDGEWLAVTDPKFVFAPQKTIAYWSGSAMDYFLKDKFELLTTTTFIDLAAKSWNTVKALTNKDYRIKDYANSTDRPVGLPAPITSAEYNLRLISYTGNKGTALLFKAGLNEVYVWDVTLNRAYQLATKQGLDSMQGQLDSMNSAKLDKFIFNNSGQDLGAVSSGDALRVASILCIPLAGAKITTPSADSLAFISIDFSSSQFTGGSLTHTQFDMSFFANATFNGMQFGYCTFPFADFRNTQMSTTVFTDCDLSSTSWVDASLNGVEFTRCTFVSSDIDAALPGVANGSSVKWIDGNYYNYSGAWDIAL